MARKVAPPKSSGGGGYNFEDEVSAWWALHLLAGHAPLEATLGAPRRIKHQARVDGWLLDDLVAEFAPDGEDPVRAAISIKSGDVLKASRIHRDFVRDCWELHLAPGKTGFDAARDRLVLASTELTRQQRKTVDDAIQRAIQQSPERMDERLLQRSWCSQEVRTFVQSFACPADISGSHPIHGQRVGALLKAVRLQDFDFTSPDSRSRAMAFSLCREQVSSGTAEDARALWEALLLIVKELRASAGEVTLEGLLDRLRGRVQLKYHPDYATDWERLAKLTQRWASDVRNTIGGIHLPRQEPLQDLVKAFQSHRTIVILGDSGVGKSALLKTLLERQQLAGPCYALHADDVARIDERALTLGPSHSLEFLVVTQPAAWTLLGLDGLERISRPQELESVARVIRALQLEEPGSPWRLLLTCQRTAWEDLRANLRACGAELSLCFPLILDRFGGAELQAVARQLPALGPLLARVDLQPLMGNAKVLDVLAGAAADSGLPDSKKWRGESSLIDWYWEVYLRSGGRDIRTPLLLEELASTQADARRFTTALSALSEGKPQLVPELQKLGVLSEQENTLHFTHDIHADYARQRRLLGWLRTDCLDEVLGRSGNPLWHRAIRLLGLHLLESSADTGERRLTAWLELFQYMEAEKSGGGTSMDLLLESLAFTPQPDPLLDELFPEVLSEREASLLRRFLVRFLYTTSVPDPDMMELARGTPAGLRADTAARYRMPDINLGLPVIEWLVRRWEQFYRQVPDELLHIATTWLRSKNKLEPQLQHAIAAMVLCIAEWTHEQGGPPRAGENRPWLYTFAMMSGFTDPERTTRLVRRLAGRPVEGSDPSSRALPDSWSDGSIQPPDEHFREALWMKSGALCLSAFDPSLAQEIFLAMLIEYPRGHARSASHETWGLHPAKPPRFPLLDFAPVHQLLERSLKNGVELVIRLLHFVTDRWKESGENESLPELTLTINGQPHTYLGDQKVFNWHKATANSQLVTAVLMALEAWLYEKLDQELLPPEFLKVLLASTHSVAIVGVLMEVALRSPELLEGPLEPLVEEPELYQWTQIREVTAQSEQWGNEPVVADEEPTSWHQMPHRSQTLLTVVAELYARRGWQWPAVERLLEKWSVIPKSRLSPLLRKELPALFDASNWKTSKDSDGHTTIEFIPPEDLLHHQEDVLKDSRSKVESLFSRLLFMRAAYFHGLLKGSEQLSEEKFEKLLESARALRGKTDDRSLLEQCGVAAVAVIVFPGYLKRSPTWKQQCREWLVAACTASRSSVLDYNPQDFDMESWSHLCAEAVPVLWHEEPDAPDLRRAMAALVGAKESETVLRLFKAAARHRAHHAEDFRRLLYLAVWFSRLIVIAGARSTQAETAQDEDVAFDQLKAAFVNQSLPSLPSAWPAIAEDWPEALERSALGSGRSAVPGGLHITYLLSAWSWLYGEADAKNSHDRDFLVDSVEGLEQLMLASLYRTQTEAAEQAPHLYRAYSFMNEGTDLPAVSATYALHTSDAATRRRLWEPWLRLPPTRQEWTSQFLEALYQLGLSGTGERSIFQAILSEILDHAHDFQSFPSVRSGQVLRALLGCPDEPTLNLWGPQHESLVAALRPQWSRWSERALADPQSADAFLTLLWTAAARCARVESLRWLTCSDPLQWLQGKTSFHSSTRDALIRLLESIWNEHRGEFKRQHDARKAFDSLLSVLVGLQNGRAIVLAQQIGTAQG